ncbi:hypothetical protein THAR02_11289 [Trichoderma harzianum]|uniref:Uncharacterized protein n=1 Tax=Trichoderma harzianum TaxID=5544 RepID=A0A0F9WTX4_TRIHA|nr:hypothetical protein THAR02_11289 [Trichoderma harzianum]
MSTSTELFEQTRNTGQFVKRAYIIRSEFVNPSLFDDVIKEHRDYLEELAAKGKLLAAGPFVPGGLESKYSGVGMIVVYADSEDDASLHKANKATAPDGDDGVRALCFRIFKSFIVRPSNCMLQSVRIRILLKDALDVALVNGDLEREASDGPSKGLTLLQKSTVAKELDTLLDDWKTRLPEYLDFSQVSFREAEWVAKQKLVLQLRYLKARIALHRLFLGVPMSTTPSQLSRHVGLCLDAARDTIRIIMAVLYIIMLRHTTVPSNELLKDVMKAHDILQSMDEAIVARRSAN